MHNRTSMQGGFTLVEAMVAPAVAALLIAIAAPSFTEASLSSQLRSGANELLSSARLARSEAIKQNAVVRMCVSTDGATCVAGSWHQGWILLRGATVLQHQPAAASGLRMTSSAAALDFQPTGFGATSATIIVCRSTPKVGRQERVVNIDPSGRARVSRTTNGTCP